MSKSDMEKPVNLVENMPKSPLTVTVFVDSKKLKNIMLDNSKVFICEEDYFSQGFINYISSKLSKSQITGLYFVEELKFLSDVYKAHCTFDDFLKMKKLIKNDYMWLDFSKIEKEST